MSGRNQPLYCTFTFTAMQGNQNRGNQINEEKTLNATKNKFPPVLGRCSEDLRSDFSFKNAFTYFQILAFVGVSAGSHPEIRAGSDNPPMNRLSVAFPTSTASKRRKTPKRPHVSHIVHSHRPASTQVLTQCECSYRGTDPPAVS